VSYLNYLEAQTDKQCALVFLIPFYYLHEATILERMTTAGVKIRLEIIYWTELLKRLEQTDVARQNVAIEHFVALLTTWFEVKHILFSEEDMKLLQNREFATQFFKLTELITEVGEKFPKPFKAEEYCDESSIGYYVKEQKGQYVLWFGCSFEYWKDYGSFFQVGVGDDEFQEFSQEVISRFKKRFGQDAIWYKPWEWYIYPLPLELINDSQNVKKLVRFIADAAAYCSGPEEK
jgi:hypothetical protein